MNILSIPEKDSKFPDWFLSNLDENYKFLKYYFKEKFEYEVVIDRNPPSYSWLLLLSTGTFDHPKNSTVDEVGWCSINNKTIYAKISNARWFHEIYNRFRWSNYSAEKLWNSYNTWKMNHEISHGVQDILRKLGHRQRDTSHDYLPVYHNYEYWTRHNYAEVSKDDDWFFVTHKVTP